MRSTIVALATLVLSASPALAQGQVRDLPKPVIEVDDPFSLVSGTLELKSGKVVAIDPAEVQLIVVDFAAGTRTVLGRTGSGPGEYRAPSALVLVPGDTLLVLDPPQARFTFFGPDLKAGRTSPIMIFDQSTNSALSVPMAGDRRGNLYASAMTIGMGQGSGGNMRMSIPDSVTIVRLDARDPKQRTELAKVRFPTSGSPEMQVISQSHIKYKMAFPGLVAADSWAVFPDGRVAIVRGANYEVQFISADGKRSAPVRVAYDPIPVTAADRDAEMAQARRDGEEQLAAAKKQLPPGLQMDFEMTAPESWPSQFPAIVPLAIFASPDGDLWVRRAIPARETRELWDQLDPNGRLVARWRLPARTTVVGTGAGGVVYTVRKDEDDLRYIQKVQIPRR